MNVLFASSEAVPFCKTGGLGDVVGALVLALKAKKQDVRLVLPKYRAIDASAFGLKPLPLHLSLPMGDTVETVTLWEGKLGGKVPVYFVDAPKYFDRDGYYRGPDNVDFPDNDERFILFSRAVLETAKAVDFRPDIIHCHDWQTGLIPAYLGTVYGPDAFFLPTSTLFTIHNIAYQGLFSKNALFTAGFSWSDFTPEKLEYYDQVNFLKAGLVYAHILNTVSPTYALEVQSGEDSGRGMEGLLKNRAHDFFGVLNGLDLKEWDPEKDKHIVRPYSDGSSGERAACKLDLQRALGLEESPDSPLLGLVSRLDPQKGIDLLLNIAKPVLEDGAQIAVLGQGEPEYEVALENLALKFPKKAAFRSDFNEPLAHKIYAGSDIFVMPSRFEPCGLGQLIALRYGSVPVVTPTGGLKDTVTPCDPDGLQGWGFMASAVNEAAYADALRAALRLYREKPEAWKKLVARAMACSFGWSKSVQKYLELYKLAGDRKKLRALVS